MIITITLSVDSILYRVVFFKEEIKWKNIVSRSCCLCIHKESSLCMVYNSKMRMIISIIFYFYGAIESENSSRFW